MLKGMLIKVYHSEISKKMGVYQHPLVLSLRKKLRKVKIWLNNKEHIKEIQAITNGDKQLTLQYLQNHTYKTLTDLSILNPKLWSAFLEKVCNENFSRINQKDTIEVAFLCNLAATWSCDELFMKYQKSEKYHPYIIVTHFYNGTSKTIEDAVMETYNFFLSKGYEVYKDYDYKKQTFYKLRVDFNPDIVFHLSPYHTAFDKEWNILNFPLTTININIPYGIYVAELSDMQYNLDSFGAFWRIFDLPFYVDLAKKYTPLGDNNRVGSGYCKLDVLYDSSILLDESSIWKKTNSKAVKIIYAPHHSIGNMGQEFSTFDKNYEQIYQLACTMKDTTSWVMKPHPLLEKSSIEAGVFASEAEFEAYIQKWKDLPNANVITGGDYFDLFKSSDAMILDSDSFLAEYLFVHKPMLLLGRKSQKFSDLGRPLSKVLYKVDGEDIQGIEAFVKEVVIGKKDVLAKDRERFFEKYLDYYNTNGVLASEYIYDYIDKHIYK